MYDIYGQSFYFFTSRTLIGNAFMMQDAEAINESVEATRGLMRATIKYKISNIKLVNGQKICQLL